MDDEKLVLRWRIHEGRLPLRQRHIRALGALELPEALVGWVLERLDWAVMNMLGPGSEAVLVVELDRAREARMSLAEVAPPPSLGAGDLVEEQGFVLGAAVGAEPLAGDVWLELDGALAASTPEVTSGTGTLGLDVARTLGIPCEVGLQPLAVARQAAEAGRAFLLSDEFGFVPIGAAPAASGPAARMREAFSRLW